MRRIRWRINPGYIPRCAPGCPYCASDEVRREFDRLKSERLSGDKNGDKPSESITETVTAESENTEKTR